MSGGDMADFSFAGHFRDEGVEEKKKKNYPDSSPPSIVYLRLCVA
ncbi:Uncharacterized protein APZ42_027827 [Daphnia magna]|uniref:Uncharacterized protein n=1 Tax=Daphnia magna TaxID=35525 RepID=A0A164R1I1_9CRUS|nr:Uncharacterized protein APZ42_027827 [Daphnia magna]